MGDASSDAAEIDATIATLGDWRGAMLGQVRALVHQADPDVIEAIKWRKPTNPAGVPVWSHGGILCTGEIYRDKVKLTFPRGAALADGTGIQMIGAGVRRAIDLREGDPLDTDMFVALIRAAVALNVSGQA